MAAGFARGLAATLLLPPMAGSFVVGSAPRAEEAILLVQKSCWAKHERPPTHAADGRAKVEDETNTSLSG